MTEFDDDMPEATEPPHGPVKVAVEIDIQRGEILGELGRQILARFSDHYASREQVDRAINRLVDKHLTDKVKTLVDDRVTAAVETALVEGWDEVKEYGYDRSAPKRVTVESLIRHALTAKGNIDDDRYSDIKGPVTVVERAIFKFMKNELAKMLGEELAAAKAKFKAAVNSLIEAKVLEAARAALKGD